MNKAIECFEKRFPEKKKYNKERYELAKSIFIKGFNDGFMEGLNQIGKN